MEQSNTKNAEKTPTSTKMVACRHCSSFTGTVHQVAEHVREKHQRLVTVTVDDKKVMVTRQDDDRFICPRGCGGHIEGARHLRRHLMNTHDCTKTPPPKKKVQSRIKTPLIRPPLVARYQFRPPPNPFINAGTMETNAQSSLQFALTVANGSQRIDQLNTQGDHRLASSPLSSIRDMFFPGIQTIGAENNAMNQDPMVNDANPLLISQRPVSLHLSDFFMPPQNQQVSTLDGLAVDIDLEGITDVRLNSVRFPSYEAQRDLTNGFFPPLATTALLDRTTTLPLETLPVSPDLSSYIAFPDPEDHFENGEAADGSSHGRLFVRESSVNRWHCEQDLLNEEWHEASTDGLLHDENDTTETRLFPGRQIKVSQKVEFSDKCKSWLIFFEERFLLIILLMCTALLHPVISDVFPHLCFESRHCVFVCVDSDCVRILKPDGVQSHLKKVHRIPDNKMKICFDSIQLQKRHAVAYVDGHWSSIRTPVPAVQGIPVVKGFQCVCCGACFSTRCSAERHQRRMLAQGKPVFGEKSLLSALVQSPHMRGRASCFPVYLPQTDMQEDISFDKIELFVKSQFANDEPEPLPAVDARFTSIFLTTVGWPEYFEDKDVDAIQSVVQCKSNHSLYHPLFGSCSNFFEKCISLITDQSFHLLLRIGTGNK